MGRPWTEAEKIEVRKARGNKSRAVVAALAKKLGRTEGSVYQRIRRPEDEPDTPERKPVVSFIGVRTTAGCTVQVMERVGGHSRYCVLDPQFGIAAESQWFEWGETECCVRGSYQLALALLCHVIHVSGASWEARGADPRDLYHALRIEVVSRLPECGWLIQAVDLLAWAHHELCGWELLQRVLPITAGQGGQAVYGPSGDE